MSSRTFACIIVSIGVLFSLWYGYLVIDRAFWVDEAFMLQVAREPTEYRLIVSLFGFLLKPVYFISSYKLWLYKLSGIAILIISSLVFGTSLYQLLINEQQGDRRNCGVLKLQVLLTICLASLLYYTQWNGLTPSYNWLNLVGLLLLWAGLLGHVHTAKLQWNTQYFALTVFGFFLISFAKPSTAFLMGFVLLIVIYQVKTSVREFAKYILVFSLSNLILLFTLSYLYFSNIFELVRILYAGALLGSHTGYSLLQAVDKIFVAYREFVTHFFPSFIQSPFSDITLFSSFILIVFGATSSRKKVSKTTWTIVLVIMFTVIILQVKRITGLIGMDDSWRTDFLFKIEVIWGAIIFICLSFFTPSIKTLFRDKQIPVIIVLLLFSQFAYAFGTNANVLKISAGAMVFSVAAIYLFVFQVSGQKSIKLTLWASVIALSIGFPISGLLVYTNNWPTDFRQAEYQISSLDGKTVLKVEKEKQSFLEHFLREAKAIGVEPGQKILGIGGTDPSRVMELTFLLGASGFPTPGFYYNYDKYVPTIDWALSFAVPDQSECVWILIAESQKQDFEDILKSYFSYPESYTLLAKKDGLELWKPSDHDDNNISGCLIENKKSR